jgi:hypothetical protein
MKFPVISDGAAREAFRLLPRLGMDEYAGFLAVCITRSDPEKVARQKAFEERITVPFRLVAEKDMHFST